MSSYSSRRTIVPGPDGPLGELGARYALEVPSRILTTERFVLRPLVADDRDAYLEAVRVSRSELDRTHPLHEAGESDEELFLRQIKLLSEGERTGRACRRVGVLGDGRIIGAFNVTAIARGLTFEGELAWWVRSDMAGRGLATEGVRAIAVYALTDLPEGLGLHTLHALIEPGNAISRRIADRIGFTRVLGVTGKVRIGEEWRTHDIFALSSGSLTSSAG
ncbi:MAG: GNAT family N-acetyltransferase [Phycisphaerales bacterium]|nr:GNAT family N-acetyltransferase [Phycisphaerales bacterium]